MEQVELALIPATMSLTEALANIRKDTRAVLVRSSAPAPLLITAGDIMAASNDAVDALQDPAQVPVGTVVPSRGLKPSPQSAPAEYARSFASDATAFAAAPSGDSFYKQWFKENDDRYAVHELRGDSVVIVTASRRFAVDLNSAVIICRCAGDPVHTFESRQLIIPDVCNKAHRATVRCSQLSFIK